jgi:hypothetical protein
MNEALRTSGPGWVLALGFVLVSLSLATGSEPSQNAPQTPWPVLPSYATGDSNNRMIAVTGIDVTGSSILYLIDTESRQISVYQAQGGTSSTMNLKWVGARRIDLDLQVDGYNDKSEFSYKDLLSKFGAEEDSEDPATPQK